MRDRREKNGHHVEEILLGRAGKTIIIMMTMMTLILIKIIVIIIALESSGLVRNLESRC